MARNYIPKDLKELKDTQLEPCPQNEILFDKLLDHIKVSDIIKLELSKDITTKEMISLSNTLNGNSKSVLALMNSFIYIEEEEENIDDYINNIGGSY